MRCERCGAVRPQEADPVAIRAWDLLHQGCRARYRWEELKAAVKEYELSGDLVRAMIAAAEVGVRSYGTT